ncbi:MAG TPA: VWA domain-containing protein [Polyangiales bacterium]|nr:VWA domain-containing protein [Polyangiales bacterium]
MSSLFPECVSTGTITASLRPTNVLFLIDRSSSMNCNLPPVTSSEDCERMPAKVDVSRPSKWEIVRAALDQAIAQLPATARAGISYFSNDDACGVQSRPTVPIRALDAEQRAALAESLTRVEPRGGTPIVGGLILAYKHLNPDQTADVPNGNRFVVLLTDGQEGCAADQTASLLERELPKSRTAGITTFVIGVPGSEVNRGFLSRLAFAGGTPSRPECDHTAGDRTAGDCQFDMTRDTDLAAGLSRALAAIGGQALRCEFDVPRPANGEQLDHDTVNVVYTERTGGEERVIAQDAAASCERANGWQYNADKSKIVLCGGACDSVRSAASIRIALGCKTAVLL